jgi:hypothetical protein
MVTTTITIKTTGREPRIVTLITDGPPTPQQLAAKLLYPTTAALLRAPVTG